MDFGPFVIPDAARTTLPDGYYVANRLLAVAYADAAAEGLSAIYCSYDPT